MKEEMHEIMEDIKSKFEMETGIHIDFRTHVYLENQYYLTPYFGYDFAEKIVSFLLNYEKEVLGKEASIKNKQMQIEALRCSRLTNMIKDLAEYIYYKRGLLKKKKFNHAFTIAFSVNSDNCPEKITESELLDALRSRVYDIEKEDIVIEAIGLPYDTYENY